ncbi:MULTISPECIES: YceI family protein [unclassified Pseudoxanthomonas]|uniref:YceI family protein n=1 Tax=unclassified Pseudoxanthomonas TaxID=2645906 RepID=UPI003F4FADEB
MAIRPASSRVPRAWASTKPRASSDTPPTGDFPMRKTLLVAALFAFAGAAFAAPVTYKLDPGHTNVLASWNHFGYSNPSANFGQADGTLVYDADKVSASSVQVTLPLTGLSALADQFYDHLTSDKWFDAAKYPSATFKSTKVEAAGEGKLKVTGDLTIKGVTKPVVLDVTLNKAGEHPMKKVPAIGFDATATVKRSDFGLGAYAPMVSDEVTLKITTEATADAKK